MGGGEEAKGSTGSSCLEAGEVALNVLMGQQPVDEQRDKLEE
jgi:hypothetical protein